MLLKDNKHDRPLYYTGYVGSICIERVQVDSGPYSASSLRGSFTFLGYHLTCYRQRLLQYMASMQEVVTHWERFGLSNRRPKTGTDMLRH